MYSYLKGRLVEKNPAWCIVECNGIGFHLHISLNTYSKLTEENCRLFTHLGIRNEATTPVGFSLYGFAEEEERGLFRKLISVSGVGNNTALLMLSSLSTAELTQAIITGNAPLLQSIKGIGGKTAQRIIVDLKDKLDKQSASDPGFFRPQQNAGKAEALAALVALGFNKNASEKVLDKIIIKQGGDLSVEKLVKEALKNL